MIAHLSGQLAVKRDDYVVIDVAGVGFQVWIPLSTYRELPREGEPATLLTYLHVREEELRLFGFATSLERELFGLLNTVQGVGAKMALDVLSHLSVENFCRAIDESQVALLCQVPGIGKKRAEKLVFDLGRQDALKRIAAGVLRDRSGEEKAEPMGSAAEEAVQALIALGTKPPVAHRAVMDTIEELGKDVAVQELIREALRRR